MDIAGLVVAIVAAAAAIAGAIFTGVQAAAARADRKDAEEARDESRSARDEAVRLSREANAAFVRQAEAQERANVLAEAALPKKEIRFRFDRVSGNRWAAQNVGVDMAYSAKLEGIAGVVIVEDDEPRNVGPGDSLLFNALQSASGTPRVRLTYDQRTETGDMRLATGEFNIPA